MTSRGAVFPLPGEPRPQRRPPAVQSDPNTDFVGRRPVSHGGRGQEVAETAIEALAGCNKILASRASAANRSRWQGRWTVSARCTSQDSALAARSAAGDQLASAVSRKRAPHQFMTASRAKREPDRATLGLQTFRGPDLHAGGLENPEAAKARRIAAIGIGLNPRRSSSATTNRPVWPEAPKPRTGSPRSRGCYILDAHQILQ